ncbi:uncharacterized protein LOC116166256 [Photinus pyralis]|uniref:uncharacterized protein LOC116166256 n=1 Tax=Photinus pyralis TaxID=7054 RepID=UPI0012673361|nr:uncharacterized protein LOC116166256 [Photinus pyralis]
MHPSVSRGFELDHPGGFASSPWAAVLGHHHSAAAAAAAAAAGGMMQTTEHHGYGTAHHPAAPMDLHMPQAFPYYRYREDTLCWTERKPTVDEVGNPTSVNARKKSAAKSDKFFVRISMKTGIGEDSEQLSRSVSVFATHDIQYVGQGRFVHPACRAGAPLTGPPASPSCHNWFYHHVRGYR